MMFWSGFLGVFCLFWLHWAFSVVFVGVVVVVGVVLVEFGRVGSCEWIQKPLWDAIVLCLCVFQQFWQYRVKKTLET